jgi:ABC-type oligopeptide transport system substrate-binding subunit
MKRTFGLLLALAAGLALAACGHAQNTGSARNGWATPSGYASATNPAALDPTDGVIDNTAKRHGGTYDSRYNDAYNAPSDFGRVPPPALATPVNP